VAFLKHNCDNEAETKNIISVSTVFLAFLCERCIILPCEKKYRKNIGGQYGFK
jgi:hypothetical protein